MTALNTKARIAGSLAYWDGKPESYCPFCPRERGSQPCVEWHAGYQATRDEVNGSADTVPLHELELGNPVG